MKPSILETLTNASVDAGGRIAPGSSTCNEKSGEDDTDATATYGQIAREANSASMYVGNKANTNHVSYWFAKQICLAFFGYRNLEHRFRKLSATDPKPAVLLDHGSL